MRGQDLHGHDNRWIRCESKRSQVLVGEMKGDGLAEVVRDLVQGMPLGDDRNLETFGHVSRFIAGRITALIVC